VIYRWNEDAPGKTKNKYDNGCQIGSFRQIFMSISEICRLEKLSSFFVPYKPGPPTGSMVSVGSKDRASATEIFAVCNLDET